ncbi:MAG TPA: hypothetical protein VJB16_01830, partial [archaeon]|nr:hypothetical protein [archaeon]
MDLAVARAAICRAGERWLEKNGYPDRLRDFAAVLYASEAAPVFDGLAEPVARYRPGAVIRPNWCAQSSALAADRFVGALLCAHGAAAQEPTEEEQQYWGQSHYQLCLFLGAPERSPEIPLVVCAGLDPFLAAARNVDAALVAGRSGPKAHAHLAPGWYLEPLLP